MKIKIIDLLNKIANDEEVPEKIKINNVIYEYRGYMYCTENANYQNIEDYLFGKWNFNILNDEVEIIEEPKKIEYEQIETLTCNEYDFEKKTINSLIKNQRKLIDEINKLKEDK